MFLRCCLLAVLLAAVPAFSASSAGDGAIRDTHLLLRRVAGAAAEAIQDTHRGLRGAAKAIEDTHVTPRRTTSSAVEVIQDTHNALRPAVVAFRDRTFGDTHNDEGIGAESAATFPGEPRHAAQPAVSLPAAFVTGTRATSRFDTCRSDLPAGDGSARSPEVTQSVIRNAAAARPGFGMAAAGMNAEGTLAA
ncbi:hypothetical protein [Tahibacter harae]|uniref:Uncharacterized protein n=1 Tax=Tahibacter harae TaxID=2963937 RepID=A0ABT1QYW6_9GAMM|nr:hypothetical protein [Tahibacter harae]MCQ4167471.1 hypothetical protein [Tahibacter harae]